MDRDVDLEEAIRRSGFDRPDHEPERPKTGRAEPKGSLLVWHGDLPPEPPPMLIESLLPQGQVAILAGQFSSGKTFVMSDLSACTMLGVPFAGREVLRPGGVLWLAAEGADEVDARITAALIARSGSDDPGRMPFARQAFAVPKLTGDEAEAELLALVADFKAGLADQHPGTDLVMIVVDTLGSAAGFLDPNHAGEAQRAMDLLRRVNKATGALVVVVDHFGKVTDTGVMGSSAKAQSADAVLAILADKTVEGDISNRRMAVAKLRGGAQGAVTPFRLQQVAVGGYGGSTCIVAWDTVSVSTDAAVEKAAKPAWSRNARILKSAMERAMIDFGKPMRPFGGQGPELKCVPFEKARAEFNVSYTAETQDAKRKAFRRQIDAAVGKGLIASREVSGIDWLWFVKDGEP